MTSDTFPRLERAGRIEVPRPVNGRPAYAWVQGWAVRYSADRVSVPGTLKDMRHLLRQDLGK